MRQTIISKNEVDANGNPTGGRTTGIGFDINWQNGPLGRDGDRAIPTGAFVEGILAAALDRLEFFQTASGGKFKCRENALAITKIEEALHWMDHRTAERERRKVEGTHVA